tara:strand:- start:445 stop:660 length:216 start_codon:yes stop_codon:yes gene_type:complete
MEKRKVYYKEQEIALLKAYEILSNAGFDLNIEEGQLDIWYENSTIEIDMEEGLCIIPEEHLEEFNQRQQQY